MPVIPENRIKQPRDHYKDYLASLPILTGETLQRIQGATRLVLGDQVRVEFEQPDLNTGIQTYDHLPQKVVVIRGPEGIYMRYTTANTAKSFEISHREVVIDAMARQRLPQAKTFVPLDELTGMAVAEDLERHILGRI